jgi:hypothetical protein
MAPITSISQIPPPKTPLRAKLSEPRAIRGSTRPAACQNRRLKPSTIKGALQRADCFALRNFLFDHLGGAKQNGLRYREAKRLGGLEIYGHLKFCRKLHRKIPSEMSTLRRMGARIRAAMCQIRAGLSKGRTRTCKHVITSEALVLKATFAPCFGIVWTTTHSVMAILRAGDRSEVRQRIRTFRPVQSSHLLGRLLAWCPRCHGRAIPQSAIAFRPAAVIFTRNFGRPAPRCPRAALPPTGSHPVVWPLRQSATCRRR